jgi:SAM-dependent methyltransferase
MGTMTSTPTGWTLHLGCGPTSKCGDVGVDVLAGPAVDVVHDLNAIPWPLGDDSFDAVLCHDVLEHLADIPGVMREVYRICRDGATVDIHVPSPSSPDLFTDPTHLRGFGHASFDYFDPTKPLYGYGYTSDIKFHVRSFEYESQGGRAFRYTDRLMSAFANRFPATYERRLLYVYPMRAIRFVLTVDKPAPVTESLS